MIDVIKVIKVIGMNERIEEFPITNFKMTIVLLSNNWFNKFNKRRSNIGLWQIMKFMEYICQSISQLLEKEEKIL